MSVVRIFHPANPLAKLVAAPGGKRLSEAVADAQAGLAAIAPTCLAQVDRRLASLLAGCAQAPDAAALGGLYQDARDIAGLAALADLPELGQAAVALCKLFDHARAGGRLTGEHLRVCADVLRSLRQARLFPPAERAEVLARLDAMVAKLTAAPPAPAAA